MKKALFIISCLFAARGAFSISAALQKGEELFLQNKPADARPLLEQALGEDPTDEKIYLYLGMVDQQLGDPDKAIAVLKRGLSVSSEYKDLFYFNIGNNFFSQGEFTFAEEMYAEAIKTNKKLADAYLNRANSRLKLENYTDALADYTFFLQLKPEDFQRPQIEAVMKAIGRLLVAQSEKKKEEEAKQKALMNEVVTSLNNASEETKNISVESLQFKRETEDVDIKD